MTDYLNPHRIYPDCPSRRIDNPPGFDSIRSKQNQDHDLSIKTEALDEITGIITFLENMGEKELASRLWLAVAYAVGAPDET